MKNNPNSSHKPCAEVVSSNLTSFTAQCWQWDTAPAFGSLVCAQQREHTIYAIVTNIQTGSQDPQRSAFAYQKTEAELKEQHPQIFEFLATTFEAVVVGHDHNGQNLTYNIAAHPAHIHSFVAAATLEQRTRFYTSASFLPLLFAAQTDGPAVDEILLAICDHIAQAGMLTPLLFEQYYHMLALLVGNDYRRLKLLLARINAQHGAILARAKIDNPSNS